MTYPLVLVGLPWGWFKATGAVWYTAGVGSEIMYMKGETMTKREQGKQVALKFGELLEIAPKAMGDAIGSTISVYLLFETTEFYQGYAEGSCEFAAQVFTKAAQEIAST